MSDREAGHRGLGDRWLAGEMVDGVRFEHGAAVEIASGRYAGRRGTVALLMDLGEDPLYLVDLGESAVRVRQSDLCRAGQ